MASASSSQSAKPASQWMLTTGMDHGPDRPKFVGPFSAATPKHFKAMVGGSTMNTYLPLCESLLQLQDAADRIFDVISKRVGLEHQQLTNICERIASAQVRVNAISGSKRATTIYSSAKFPRADPSVVDFVPLFENTRDRQSKTSADTVYLNIGRWQSQQEGTLELFQFFSETSHEYWLKDHKHKDGVGKVPSGVKSVADVLLFNSDELQYHKYKIVDNMAGPGHLQGKEEFEIKPAALPAAPQSVLGGDVLPSTGAVEYGFRPVLRQVPSFSLPSVLPELPSVAEITWSGMVDGVDQLSSIAPSAAHGLFSPRSNSSAMLRFGSASASTRFDPMSASPRLDLVLSSTNTDPDTASTRSDLASENGSIHQQEVLSPVLPALKMLEVHNDRNLETKLTKTRSGESSSGSTRSFVDLPPLPVHQSAKVDIQKDRIPAPPPPPPAPPLLPPPGPSKVGTVQTKPMDRQPIPPIDSQRVALMASIRSSGLDLLRKTGRSESSSTVPSPVMTPAVALKGVESLDKIMPVDVKKPIDVMAEMARSLTLRRLSMRAASRHQGAVRSDKGHQSDGSANSSGNEMMAETNYSQQTLPDLHAKIKQRSAEESEDEDDDDWE